MFLLLRGKRFLAVEAACSVGKCQHVGFDGHFVLSAILLILQAMYLPFAGAAIALWTSREPAPPLAGRTTRVEGEMVTTHLSQSSFSHRLSEAALATALALPVIFAFTELRGSWLARGEVPPQLVNLQRSMAGDAKPEGVSPSAIMTSITPQVRQVPKSGGEAVANTVGSRTEAKGAGKKLSVGPARAANGRNRDNSDPVTKAETSPQDNRPVRHLHPQGLENSSRIQP